MLSLTQIRGCPGTGEGSATPSPLYPGPSPPLQPTVVMRLATASVPSTRFIGKSMPPR